MIDTISSVIQNPKAAIGSLQYFKYLLITYLILLSSINSFAVIIGSNESLEVYALIIDKWSLRSIWEQGTINLRNIACVLPQCLHFMRKMDRVIKSSGVLIERL